MAVMYYIVVQIAHNYEMGMLTGDLIPLTSSVDRLFSFFFLSGSR